MDFLEEIKNLSDDELKERLQERIEELEEKSDEENEEIDTIGYIIDYNPTNYNIEDCSNFPIELTYLYSGYIQKGMRVVFGMTFDYYHIASNAGEYYYVDDDSYILEFCNYIKDEEITNEYEFFSYVLEFIDNYFGRIKDINRSDMFKMITRSGRNLYNPIKDHKFSEFKGRGNAMCTEYTLMASNILNVFGFETSFALGKVEVGDDRSGHHAFNIIEFTERESNRKINAIMDFAYPVKVHDKDYHLIDKSPFFGELEVEDDKIMDYLSDGDNTFTFEDYGYILLGNSLFKIGYNVNRNYNITNEFTPETSFIKKK